MFGEKRDKKLNYREFSMLLQELNREVLIHQFKALQDENASIAMSDFYRLIVNTYKGKLFPVYIISK